VRRKRNQNTYERAGTTSSAEAAELHDVVTGLRRDVVRWLRENHREIYPHD